MYLHDSKQTQLQYIHAYIMWNKHRFAKLSTTILCESVTVTWLADQKWTPGVVHHISPWNWRVIYIARGNHEWRHVILDMSLWNEEPQKLHSTGIRIPIPTPTTRWFPFCVVRHHLTWGFPSSSWTRVVKTNDIDSVEVVGGFPLACS
jgi:hypothetical protein